MSRRLSELECDATRWEYTLLPYLLEIALGMVIRHYIEKIHQKKESPRKTNQEGVCIKSTNDPEILPNDPKKYQEEKTCSGISPPEATPEESQNDSSCADEAVKKAQGLQTAKTISGIVI